jgi:5-(carboxyamino)imidazole ribonucleotide mutase
MHVDNPCLHAEDGGMSEVAKPLVGVIMGSRSDWDTMLAADEILTEFDVPHECQIVSAHRTPDWMSEYAKTAESRGLEVIIAGAGGAAHLPGMVASLTVLPVLGVPVESRALKGMDSLLSIVQMPGGVPVGTLAIGASGAKNAGLLAVRILAGSRPELREKLHAFQKTQCEQVRQDKLS